MLKVRKFSRLGTHSARAVRPFGAISLYFFDSDRGIVEVYGHPWVQVYMGFFILCQIGTEHNKRDVCEYGASTSTYMTTFIGICF